MSAHVVSRTVEVSASGRRTVHTTTEAPTMNEALAMMQVIRMQDAGIDFDQWVATLLPKDARRAVAYFEKRNGPIAQAGLPLALSA